MAKEYKIWAVVEEHDTETDEYHDISDQTEIACFDTEEEAFNQLKRIEAVGGSC